MKLSREDAIKELFKISPAFVNYIYKNNKNIYNLFYILVLNEQNYNADEPLIPGYMTEDIYVYTYNNIYFYYSSLCHITFNLFIFLETHHIPISNDPNLSEFYHLVPDLINKLIYFLSENVILKSVNTHNTSIDFNTYEKYECRCNYYYSYASGIEALMDEYNELNEYVSNQEDLQNKLDAEYSYSDRKDYRIYNLNFINPDDCCHDKTKMICELENWKKYFHSRCPCEPIYNSDTLLEQHCCYCKYKSSSLEIQRDNCKYFNEIRDTLSLIRVKNNTFIPSDCARLISYYI